jgi:hypothetical protein
VFGRGIARASAVRGDAQALQRDDPAIEGIDLGTHSHAAAVHAFHDVGIAHESRPSNAAKAVFVNENIRDQARRQRARPAERPERRASVRVIVGFEPVDHLGRGWRGQQRRDKTDGEAGRKDKTFARARPQPAPMFPHAQPL